MLHLLSMYFGNVNPDLSLVLCIHYQDHRDHVQPSCTNSIDKLMSTLEANADAHSWLLYLLPETLVADTVSNFWLGIVDQQLYHHGPHLDLNYVCNGMPMRHMMRPQGRRWMFEHKAQHVLLLSLQRRPATARRDFRKGYYGMIKTHEDTRSVKNLVANPLWLMKLSKSWSYVRLLAFVQESPGWESLIFTNIGQSWRLALVSFKLDSKLKAEVARSFKNLLHG